MLLYFNYWLKYTNSKILLLLYYLIFVFIDKVIIKKKLVENLNIITMMKIINSNFFLFFNYWNLSYSIIIVYK